MDTRQAAHGRSEALRTELVEPARVAGLLSPYVALEWGRLGLDHAGKCLPHWKKRLRS